MDPTVYKAAKDGTESTSSNYDFGDVDARAQVTCQVRNTILHVAVKHGNKKTTQQILDSHHRSGLVSEANENGDTPLHCAARLGYLDVAELLMNSLKSQGSVEHGTNPLRALNVKKNTALHEAVQNGHYDIVDLLIKEDPSLAFFRNNAGESPLFMAVDRRFYGISLLILETSCGDSSLLGRNGMNFMHAAVIAVHDRDQRMQKPWRKFSISICRFLASRLKLTWGLVLNNTHQRSITGEEFVQMALAKCGADILEKKDDFGWNPLHYAAYTGNAKVVKLFLKTNSSLAYIKDNEGMSALHICAKSGHIGVIKILIQEHPDVCELLDNKNRTALHIAVESRRGDVIRVFLRTRDFADLINEQDKQGNTAFHLAALHGWVGILKMLAKDERVDKGAINNIGMTATDIIRANKKLKEYKKDLALITEMLKSKGAHRSLERSVVRQIARTRQTNGEVQAHDISQEIELIEVQSSEDDPPGSSSITRSAEENEKDSKLSHAGKKEKLHDKRNVNDYRYESLKNLAQVNLIVATIIASITFTAAISMPGGYNNANGMAILRTKPAFRNFLVFDSLAFGCSAASMCIHYIFAFTSRLKKHLYYPLSLVYILTDVSIVCSVGAFAAAMNAVLNEKSKRSSDIPLPSTLVLYSFGAPLFLFLIIVLISYIRGVQSHIVYMREKRAPAFTFTIH